MNSTRKIGSSWDGRASEKGRKTRGSEEAERGTKIERRNQGRGGNKENRTRQGKLKRCRDKHGVATTKKGKRKTAPKKRRYIAGMRRDKRKNQRQNKKGAEAMEAEGGYRRGGIEMRTGKPDGRLMTR